MRQKTSWWIDKLKHFGWKITIPRRAILDLFCSTSKHLSAEDIYFTIHKKCPATGLTTVYRTLELLEQKRLIHKFDFGDGHTRYEMVEGAHKKHHHHLVCTACGRVIDYSYFINEETELITQMEVALSKRYNFKIVTHQVHFYGLCNKCKNKG